MKQDFTNDEFEDFLKSSSDRMRMRPSDAVWKGISDNLNKRRRRFGWITGSFLVATSLVGYLLSQTTERLHKSVAVEASQQKGLTQKAPDPITSVAIAATSPNENAHLKTTPSFDETSTSLQSLKAPKRTSLTVAYKKPAEPIAEDAIADMAQTNANTTDESIAPFESTIIDSDPEAQPDEVVATGMEMITNDPLTIESVTNLQMALKKARKMNVEFFFTPTVSYRKLSENKSYMTSVPVANATPNYAALYNINDAVTHKPSIGLELGIVTKHPVASNIQLLGGLQFNMSRYDVKAFSNYSYQPATLALSSGTRTQPTNYSNFNGMNSDWLQNLYFQVSAPVGLEVKFGQADKTQFGISSTVQPTYMLGDRVYLISSDYKNYVEVPWLMRRWNVNTALETFVSYSTGKLNWQVGPQVRYQLLSSFVSKYPVKEHLFDFGLKVGVSLNNK